MIRIIVIFVGFFLVLVVSVLFVYVDKFIFYCSV